MSVHRLAHILILFAKIYLDSRCVNSLLLSSAFNSIEDIHLLTCPDITTSAFITENVAEVKGSIGMPENHCVATFNRKVVVETVN